MGRRPVPTHDQQLLLADLADGDWHVARLQESSTGYTLLTLWECVQAGWVEPLRPTSNRYRITVLGAVTLGEVAG